MLSFMQEETVKSWLQELKNLQIKTRIIESSKAKGLTKTDEQEDLQVALQTVRLAAIEIAKALAEMFESKGFDFFAERLKNQIISSDNLEKDLAELDQLIAEIQRETEKRLDRNIRRRKQIEAAEKQAEQTNEKMRAKQTAFTPKVRSAESMLEEQIPYAKSAPRLLSAGGSRLRYSAYPAKLTQFPQKQKEAKKKPNIRYAKTSEAKAKDFANQRALKKSEMSMTRSAPVFGPSQMSR